MNIVTVAYYTFLRNLRDYKMMAAFTIVPILLIFIIGSAEDDNFTPKNLKTSELGYVVEDSSGLSRQLEEYLVSEKLSPILNARPIPNVEQGKKLVQSGELDAFLYLPKSAPGSESPVTLTLYGKGQWNAAKPILESFAQQANLARTVQVLDASSPSAGTDGSNAGFNPSDAGIETVMIETKGKIPDGIDYFSVTTMLQCLLIGSVLGVFAVTKDQHNDIRARLYSSPVSPKIQWFGKWLGTTVTLFIPAVFSMLFTKYVYMANWNGNMFIILPGLFLFTGVSIAIGMVLARLTNSAGASSAIGMFLMMLFTLTSGGFSPNVNDTLKQIGRLSPNHYAQEAIFSTIYKKGTEVAAGNLGVLFLYAVVLVGITMALPERRNKV